MSSLAPESSAPDKLRFFGVMPEGFDRAVVEWGWPRFRGKQVRDWVYTKLVADPAGMTNLSKADRDQLAARVDFATAAVARRQDSADGTKKLLLTWGDDGRTAAETVMIPDGDRRTACVSSQVGCPVGCRFCASGLNGVKGNLSADQIVEQVFRLNQALNGRLPGSEAAVVPTSQVLPQPHAPGDTRPPAFVRPPRITNIVFMGMGEPLANYNNVMQAVRQLHDPATFNIGGRRITISTVGVPSRIRDLAGEDLPLNLALSLHAPNEELRRELIPWAEHFALPEILDACRYYFDRTGREITLEYILLSGVNDRPEHARQLAKLCRTLRANVNLIRYNEVAGLPYQRPKADDVMAFQTILRAAGVNAHVRKSRGRDIDAACGQLRRKQQEDAADAAVVAAAATTQGAPSESLVPLTTGGR
jgi:23S rRNA (adenine2503-C2)-methyltransferase